jgi:hypothetical protein
MANDVFKDYVEGKLRVDWGSYDSTISRLTELHPKIKIEHIDRITSDFYSADTFFIQRDDMELQFEMLPGNKLSKLRWETGPSANLSLNRMNVWTYRDIPKSLGWSFGWQRYPADSEVKIQTASNLHPYYPGNGKEDSEVYGIIIKKLPFKYVGAASFKAAPFGVEQAALILEFTRVEGASRMSLIMPDSMASLISPELINIVFESHIAPVNDKTVQGELAEVMRSLAINKLP